MDYEDLPSEQIHPDGPELDLLPPADIARLLLDEEARVHHALEGAIDDIGRACELAAAAKRIIYAGAGTSGRLGVLDASEMGPTFGAEPGRVIGLLAGTPEALTKSVEGAEDDHGAGYSAYMRYDPQPTDCVVGITMSGTAAYVDGALSAGHGVGARRVLITANPDSAIAADVRVVLELGPELLAGSTRLKGGSATKAVLNMISTAAMAHSGAVYGNLMVRVKPTNKKLRDRAERLVARIAEVDRERAAQLLVDGGDDVRVAVLIARKQMRPNEAHTLLKVCKGSLREALA